MTVTLDDHKVLNFDGAKVADAADVIAGEVHKHHVFGAFLGIGQEFLLQSFILRGGFAAAASAGDGPNFDFFILAANVNFRRSADERKTAEFEQKHVR